MTTARQQALKAKALAKAGANIQPAAVNAGGGFDVGYARQVALNMVITRGRHVAIENAKQTRNSDNVNNIGGHKFWDEVLENLASI